MNIIKKISAKAVCGDVKKLIKDMKKQTAIMRVYGVANGVKTGSSNFGEWTALMGSFKAENLLTGDKFSSGKCFLPDVAMEMIIPVVQGGQPVEFALDVMVNPDETMPAGYEYNIRPLIEATEDDAMARLEAQVTAKLEAPAKPPKK